jgi:hypothetical protein
VVPAILEGVSPLAVALVGSFAAATALAVRLPTETLPADAHAH